MWSPAGGGGGMPGWLWLDHRQLKPEALGFDSIVALAFFIFQLAY